MDYIYNTSVIQIIKNKNNYTIKSTHNNFFKEILYEFNVQSEKETTSTEINVKLDSVVSLQEYLNNKPDKLLELYEITFVIQDLIKQINYLESNNKTVSHFSIEDFLILNNNLCLFIGLDKIYDFDKNGNFQIQELFKKNNRFLSPEIKNMTTIPALINYKSCYYSLGLLILKIFIDIEISNENEFIEKTNLIRGLPSYWFIKNLLVENHNDRHILYI